MPAPEPSIFDDEWIDYLIQNPGDALCDLANVVVDSFQAVTPGFWVRTDDDFEKAVSDRSWRLVDGWLELQSEDSIQELERRLALRSMPLLPLLVECGAPVSVLETALDKGARADARVEFLGDGHRASYTAAHIAAEKGAVESLQALLEAEPELLTMQTVDLKTPLHIALERSLVSKETQWEIVYRLISSGADLSEVPAELFVGARLRDKVLGEEYSGKDLSYANLIGADLSKLKIYSDDGSLLTSLRGATYSPDTIFPQGFYPQLEGMQKATHAWVDGKQVWMDETDLATAREDAKSTFTFASRCLHEAGEFGDRGNGDIDFLLYAETYNAFLRDYRGVHMDIVDDFVRKVMQEDFGPESFGQMLRKLDLMKEGEDLNDTYPYLPELLLLCRDPRLDLADRQQFTEGETVTEEQLDDERNRIEDQRRQLEPYSLSITSIMGWMANDPLARATTRTIYDWGRIGQLTRDFLRHKFDTRAQSDGKAFIEWFGFERIPTRETDFLPQRKDERREHNFGPGFALYPGTREVSFLTDGRHKELDDNCYVEYRRAYYLISHPEHGTLVVRNSSPNFGRDRLPFTAAWSEKGVDNGYSIAELQELDKWEFDRAFTSVLEPSLHHSTLKETEEGTVIVFEAQDHIHELLDLLEGVRNAVHAFKCNTNRFTGWGTLTDFEGNQTHRITGLHRSEGFGRFVDALSNEWEKQGESLSLALVPEDFAPLYSFEVENENGFPASSLVLTEERMQALSYLATYGWNQQVVEESGLDGFFRSALDFQAHVVVLYKDDEV